MLRGHAPGRSSDLPYWSVLKLEVGQKVNGWLAGPCIGYEVHHVRASRPCLTDVTGGEVPCPLCEAKLSREWRGYVPIWDDLVVRRVCLIGKRYFHLVEKVRPLQPVMCRKLREWGSPVCVQRAAWTTDEPTLKEADRRPQELGDWLIQMWKEPALTEWARAKAAAGRKPPASVTGGKVTVPDPSFKERVEFVKDRIVVTPPTDTRGPSMLGDVLPHVLNGKHKKG